MSNEFNKFNLKLKENWKYDLIPNPLGIQYIFPTQKGYTISVMGRYSKFGGSGLWEFAILKENEIQGEYSETDLTCSQIEQRLKKFNAINEL